MKKTHYYFDSASGALVPQLRKDWHEGELTEGKKESGWVTGHQQSILLLWNSWVIPVQSRHIITWPRARSASYRECWKLFKKWQKKVRKQHSVIESRWAQEPKKWKIEFLFLWLFLVCYLDQLYNNGRRQWHPTPVLLPGKSHGWRGLVGCSPWGHKESDTTELLHFHFSLWCIGEGNGNPLQCSCLENPRDGEAWWAEVYGVTQSPTRLKWLSNSNSNTLVLSSSKQRGI